MVDGESGEKGQRGTGTETRGKKAPSSSLVSLLRVMINSHMLELQNSCCIMLLKSHTGIRRHVFESKFVRNCEVYTSCDESHALHTC